MSTSSHDFVTVDMRGLKAALVVRARADRVSVSVPVRRAVARDLGLSDVPTLPTSAASPDMACRPTTVKLSIRLTRTEAELLDAGARAAGLRAEPTSWAWLPTSPCCRPVLGAPTIWPALIASGAELSTLGRDIRHLTSLLRQGEVRAAQVYREMLDTLAGDVQRR